MIVSQHPRFLNRSNERGAIEAQGGRLDPLNRRGATAAAHARPLIGRSEVHIPDLGMLRGTDRCGRSIHSLISIPSLHTGMHVAI